MLGTNAGWLAALAAIAGCQQILGIRELVPDGAGGASASGTSAGPTASSGATTGTGASTGTTSSSTGGGPPSTWQRVAAGGYHTCAQKLDGTLWCWGGDDVGQIGDGSVAPVKPPVHVLPSSKVQALALGQKHTCATSGGAVWCWGAGQAGQLGDGSNDDASKPVSVLTLNIANAVSAGTSHSCAAQTGPGGLVWCWGSNANGKLGDGTTNASNAPVMVSGLGAVDQIAVGETFSCALSGDNVVSCWGYNGSSQLGDGDLNEQHTPHQVPFGFPPLKAKDLAAGVAHACAVLVDGSLRCWGANASGQLGIGTTGQTGPNYLPATVMGLPAPAQQVAAGLQHTCAVLTDHSLWCWGDNSRGQLGAGKNAMSMATTPVQVTALGNQVAAVAAGYFHSCAIKTDGTLWCWGSNDNGQLGFSGMKQPQYPPTQLP